jgi:site-specific recombinase XerD
MSDSASISTSSIALVAKAPAGPALAKIAPPAAPDQDPVAVYLAGLGSPKSRRTMRAALDTIADELGAPSAYDIPWGALRYPHVAALRVRLAEKRAPATVNKILCALRGVAREAMRLGKLDAGEYTKIADVEGLRGSRLPAGRHVEMPELVSMFAACARTTPIGARDAALLAVLRVAGLRRDELAALALEDLDREAWTLRVLGKGNKERRAYVVQARAEIEAWIDVRGEAAGPLFCAVNKAGRPTMAKMGESSIAYVLGRVAARAGVKDVSPHDMRRTFVGDLLDAGADIAVVQRLAGHAQVTTTQRYDRRGERAAAKAAALIGVPRVA